MVYDVDIIYEATLFTVQFANSQILLSSNEDIFSNFQGWGYVGLTGYHKGTARKMNLDSAMICEDNLSSNYIYKWYLAQTINLPDISVPAGTIMYLSVMFLDGANKYIPHFLGLGLYDRKLNMNVPCGQVFFNQPSNSFELIFTVSLFNFRFIIAIMPEFTQSNSHLI